VSRILKCTTNSVFYSLKLLFARYKHEFGFVIPDRPILIDDIRVRGVGKSPADEQQTIADAVLPPIVELVICVLTEYWDSCFHVWHCEFQYSKAIIEKYNVSC